MKGYFKCFKCRNYIIKESTAEANTSIKVKENCLGTCDKGYLPDNCLHFEKISNKRLKANILKVISKYTSDIIDKGNTLLFRDNKEDVFAIYHIVKYHIHYIDASDTGKETFKDVIEIANFLNIKVEVPYNLKNILSERLKETYKDKVWEAKANSFGLNNNVEWVKEW